MEHILQVAFQFDDEAVKKRLEDQCFTEVVDRLIKEYKVYATKDYNYNGYANPWTLTADQKLDNKFTQLVEDHVADGIHQYCEKHKDEIIELAAVKLADKLAKTKKAKEILNDSVHI